MSALQDDPSMVMSLLHRSSGRRPTFFAGGGVDQLFSMVIELASEVWVVRERLYVVEDVIERNGQDLRRQVETWSPTTKQADELASMRELMMKHLFRTVTAEPAKSDDDMTTADPNPPER